MTEATWTKNAIRVQLQTGLGKKRTRTFNNIAQNVTGDQLEKFGHLIALLTGETFLGVTETTTTSITGGKR